MELFDEDVVLFESDEGEEAIAVECAVTRDGGLVILQESSGPLTEWCFEETPHRVEVSVDPAGVRGLMSYFHLERPGQVPAVLRLSYVGHDCCRQIRDLLKMLGVSYHVVESQVVR